SGISSFRPAMGIKSFSARSESCGSRQGVFSGDKKRAVKFVVAVCCLNYAGIAAQRTVSHSSCSFTGWPARTVQKTDFTSPMAVQFRDTLERNRRATKD